jgi:phosphatidylglycerol:prolipoprotein diacylglycerol transferase
MEELTAQQQHEVTHGKYRCLPIHPTQLYASAHAFLLCGVLYLLWRRSVGEARSAGRGGWLARPGVATAALCILYGPGRFVLEAIRDDNPYEFAMLTISQIMGIAMFVAGLVLLAAHVANRPSVGSDGARADTPDVSSPDDVVRDSQPEPDAG